MMVIITFYRGHDDLLEEQKLKAGRSSHKHTCAVTKMICQTQMISSPSVNQSMSWSYAFIQMKYLNDGLSFTFVQTIEVPRG